MVNDPMRALVILLALTMASPVLAEAEGDHGRNVFKKCKSCHQIGEGATDRVGPNLNGVLGRAAGAIEGFRYSKAMIAAAKDGLVWDIDTLDAYLTKPRDYMKGTRMSFRGLKDARDRSTVIAYLAEASTTAASNRDPDVAPEILALEGDPDYGEYLSGECVTCHRSDGGDNGIPSITGWDNAAFVTALHAYKNKHRDHPVMQLATSRLNDEEIAGLAAFFATQQQE